MYRAEIVGTKAAIALGEAGHRRPWVVSTVHSSRVRSTRRPGGAAPADGIDRPPDRGVERHRPQGRRRGADEPRRGRSSTTASTSSRYDHQEPCCTLRDEYGMEPTSPIVGVVGRLELEKGHPTLLEAWPLVLEACPSAFLVIVGEGSRLDALHDDRPRAGDRRPRRVHRAARRHPGGHRGVRRRGPAFLPRGAGPHDPRGDGALATRGRVERGRDPRDDRGRRHGAARPAPGPAGARRRPSSGCCPTTSWPTSSGAPATTSSTTGSASS